MNPVNPLCLYLGHLFGHVCTSPVLAIPIYTPESQKGRVLIVHQPKVVEYTVMSKAFLYVVYVFTHLLGQRPSGSAKILKIAWTSEKNRLIQDIFC